MAPEIVDPYSRKYEIVLLGKRVKVPAGDLLLRCFQFLFGNRISYGRFCWNNECGNCEIRCILPGERREQTVRACQYPSKPGLRITEVPVEFRVFMQAPEEEASSSGEPTPGGGASIR